MEAPLPPSLSPSLPFFLPLSPQFAEQENQVAHLELGQVECQLKTTLEVLRERSLQCEDLKDTVENLRQDLRLSVLPPRAYLSLPTSRS